MWRKKTYKVLRLALVHDLDIEFPASVDDFEGVVLHFGLDLSVIELAADETLGAKGVVVEIHDGLALCGISNETLSVGEGDIGRGGTVALIVGYSCEVAPQ